MFAKVFAHLRTIRGVLMVYEFPGEQTREKTNHENVTITTPPVSCLMCKLLLSLPVWYLPKGAAAY